MAFEFSRFKELYPRFESPPELLQRAFDKAQESIGLLVGDMAFRDTYYYTLVKWLQEDENAAGHFIPIATDGTDGIYAYWFYDDRPLEKAPIVYLESENNGSGVIANSLAEFLAIMGIGRVRMGDVAHWNSKRDEEVDDLAEYLDWLEGTAGVQPITDPDAARAVVENARRAHPDLEAWLDAWFDEHPPAGTEAT